MFSRSTIATLLLCLLALAVSMPSVQAIPPRRAQQLQNAGAIPSGGVNKKWVPPGEDDQPAATVNDHVRCESTTKLVECRDICYTTYGPYSHFHSDCLECCRKVCKPTAYCPADINYWQKRSPPSSGIRKYLEKKFY